MRKVKSVCLALMVSLMVFAWVAPVMAAGAKVNINTAAKEELMSLKYIGAQNAERIIAYRTAHKFATPEDIMNVKGIGQKTFDANKDLIVVKD